MRLSVFPFLAILIGLSGCGASSEKEQLEAQSPTQSNTGNQPYSPESKEEQIATRNTSGSLRDSLKRNGFIKTAIACMGHMCE